MEVLLLETEVVDVLTPVEVRDSEPVDVIEIDPVDEVDVEVSAVEVLLANEVLEVVEAADVVVEVKRQSTVTNGDGVVWASQEAVAD